MTTIFHYMAETYPMKEVVSTEFNIVMCMLDYLNIIFPQQYIYLFIKYGNHKNAEDMVMTYYKFSHVVELIISHPRFAFHAHDQIAQGGDLLPQRSRMLNIHCICGTQPVFHFVGTILSKTTQPFGSDELWIIHCSTFVWNVRSANPSHFGTSWRATALQKVCYRLFANCWMTTLACRGACNPACVPWNSL